VGTVTVFKYDTLGLLEIQTAKQNVRFPYIPTLFAFREFPVIDACIKKLHFKPEVVLVDGHGQTHPLNCGLASHLGVLLNLPTIGVAKSRLVGEKRKIGDRVFLVQNENIVGEIVTTSKNRKPVYVSIGHMVSLRTAVDIVRNTQKHRIPEPIRWAHIIASKKIKDLN
jgi:deoxyribonuclease V